MGITCSRRDQLVKVLGCEPEAKTMPLEVAALESSKPTTAAEVDFLDVLVVKLTGEAICEIRVDVNHSVQKLKDVIEETAHVSAQEQQLSNSGIILRDEVSL